jgi:hypothetical protein
MKKIQTKTMKKDIERSSDITVAWLQGGKAIGAIISPKKKRKKGKQSPMNQSVKRNNQ